MTDHRIPHFISVILLYFSTGNLGAADNLTVNDLKCKFTGIDAQLNIASQMIDTVRKEIPTDLNNLCGSTPNNEKPMDCSDIYIDGRHSDGVYEIWPQNRIQKGSLKVYCDMNSDSGGWTVIQRRGDFDSSKDYFYQDWNSYKAGFGDLLKDFWIGNDNLYSLTNQRAYQIKFDLRDWEQNSTYATYDEFWIDDEPHSYTLHVKGYRGTAGDSFGGHNGTKFTTKDKDNDAHADNCAVLFKGAWWYTACHASNLNGYYLKGKHESHADGVEWHTFRGHYYSLKDSVMKIRPLNFGNELHLERTPE